MAVELRRRLGDRVEMISVTGGRMIVATSWLVLDAPPFVGALQALQDTERWRQAREQLFSMWLTSAPEGVVERVRREMGAYELRSIAGVILGVLSSCSVVVSRLATAAREWLADRLERLVMPR